MLDTAPSTAAINMRLINETSWADKDLKAICVAGLKHRCVRHSEYVVHVKSSNMYRDRDELAAKGEEFWIDSNGIALHGKAFYSRIWWKKKNVHGKYFIEMWLPKQKFSIDCFAMIFQHEIDHTLGLHHKDMMQDTLRDNSWAKGFSILPQTV